MVLRPKGTSHNKLLLASGRWNCDEVSGGVRDQPHTSRDTQLGSTCSWTRWVLNFFSSFCAFFVDKESERSERQLQNNGLWFWRVSLSLLAGQKYPVWKRNCALSTQRSSVWKVPMDASGTEVDRLTQTGQFWHGIRSTHGAFWLGRSSRGTCPWILVTTGYFWCRVHWLMVMCTLDFHWKFSDWQIAIWSREWQFHWARVWSNNEVKSKEARNCTNQAETDKLFWVCDQDECLACDLAWQHHVVKYQGHWPGDCDTAHLEMCFKPC